MIKYYMVHWHEYHIAVHVRTSSIIHNEICIMCTINHRLNVCIKRNAILNTNQRLRNQWISSVAHKWNTSRRQRDKMIAGEYVSGSIWFPPFFLKNYYFVLYLLLCSALSRFVLARVTSKTIIYTYYML